MMKGMKREGMISEGMEKERMTGELEMEWNDNRI